MDTQFWLEQTEFKDLFQEHIESQSFDFLTINRLIHQYSYMEHQYIPELQALLGKLLDAVELMAPFNGMVVDLPEHERGAKRLYDDICSAKAHLSTLNTHSALEKQVIHHAREYASFVMENIVNQLQAKQPDALALSWYKEWEKTSHQ